MVVIVRYDVRFEEGQKWGVYSDPRHHAERLVTSRAKSVEDSSFIGGVDALRVAATLLVTAFHALVVTGGHEWTTFRSVDMGQLGVAIFLGISALLGSTSPRSPIPWLVQRLRCLFPAYWIVTIVGFLLAGVTGYKTFSPGQVVSQIFGLGFFTHPENLVNVATWFITLLLVCYVCLFFVRLVNRPLLAPLLLIFSLISYAILTGRLWFDDRYWSWLHCITFFAASALAAACPADRRPTGFLAAGIVVLIGAPFSILFAYTGITLVSIGAALGLSKVPKAVHVMASYSYEYYLVHGILLVGVTRALPSHPAIAVASGVVLAALASVALQKVARWP